jgi:hypothetical protein
MLLALSWSDLLEIELAQRVAEVRGRVVDIRCTMSILTRADTISSKQLSPDFCVGRRCLVLHQLRRLTSCRFEYVRADAVLPSEAGRW